MADYEHADDVPAGADELFAYLSDVRNLPKYFARMTSARPVESEAVHTTARLEEGEGGPAEVEGEAWFRVHDAEKRLEWGSEGPSGYRGELDVTGDASGSRVAVRLHTDHDDPPGVQDGLRETVGNIKRLVGGAAA